MKIWDPLVGSEVKSLRNGKVSLDEAYGRLAEGEVWLVGCDIPEYAQATIWNHEPKRPRKLLVHKREVRKFNVPEIRVSDSALVLAVDFEMTIK